MVESEGADAVELVDGEVLTSVEVAKDAIAKAFKPTQECRAHEAGRCMKGDACPEAHNLLDEDILCCSVMTPKSKYYNARFLKCPGIRVGKECPYSHALQLQEG